MTRPAVGDPVPAFEMTADDGAAVSDRTLAGRRYILYFYPKDDTPGCTAQACSLRDNYEQITALGAEIYGVSPDNAASHLKFKAKYDLPHPLLSDVGHLAADAFGVWVEKSYLGRTYRGTERTSFVIGPDARIEHVLPQVKPMEHVDRLVALLGR